MTCIEKLKADNPGLDNSAISEILEYECPHDYGYVKKSPRCGKKDYSCKDDCWMREIDISDKKTILTDIASVIEDEGFSHVINTPVIKDSGDRTEFASGAVRDMHEGKGRCDLMPLEVAANLLNGRSLPAKEDGQVLHNVKTFLEKNDTYYLYLALEHFADKYYERSVPTMFLEVAKHFEEGAKKYGENNWQKGIPVHCYIDSAVRHYLKWVRGDKDEPHDRAFVWNLMCCIWEVDYHKPED